jgi:CHAT domain-containing protein
MKQKILLIMLAAALLILSACDGGTDNPGQTGFVGGTKE